MPLVPRPSANRSKMQTKLSAWTPLNHPQTNSRVFEERRSLLAKWFARWTNSQRKAVLQDFVLKCSLDQLRFLGLVVGRQLPLEATDFTCLLPRVLCLYIFSFLDPRTLCRCAQVSWHWRSMVELDQLWMRKCVRLGWCVHFSPTPLEQGVWKRHYIHTVKELRHSLLQTASFRDPPAAPDVATISSRQDEPPELAFVGERRPASSAQTLGGRSCGTGLKKEKQPAALPPWRDSDKHPKDTIRFNYLDNLDDGARTVQTAPTRSAGASKPDEKKTKAVSESNYKLRKAKSLMFLSSNRRPHNFPPSPPLHQSRAHTPDGPTAMETAVSLLRLTQWNSGIRPGPARTSIPRLSAEALRASRRSHRSAPSVPLLEARPCTASQWELNHW